jgi:hypothetical protein
MQPSEPPTEHIPAVPLHRNRRRHRRAATLGLLALPAVGSAFVLPAIANAQSATAPTATAGVSAAAVSTPGTVPDETALQAYFDAGYTFDDAVDIAQRWSTDQDVFQLKVELGGFLAAGTPLSASPVADPTADDELTPEQLIEAFFGWGYTTEDAQVLAERWGVDLSQAKVKAGSELKTVGALPFVDVVPVYPDQAAYAAFFATGYDYDDAVLLAQHWGLATPADAKAKAGELLRSGQQLPAVDGVAN